MRVMIDIPKEFESDLQDKFNEFFERMIADINYALEKQEPLLCGNYERETAEMFLSAFEKATIIPNNATNGDMIKAIFPNCEQKEHMNNGYFEMYFNNDLKDASYMRVRKDFWRAKYKNEVEE